MIYPEYVKTAKARDGAWLRWQELLMERDALFQMTQPGAIRYDSVKVMSSVSGSPLETYMEELARRHLDERIAEAKRLYDAWETAMSEIRQKLSDSPELEDNIYFMRMVRRYSVKRIARVLHYSPDWIYKKIRKIEKSLK